MALTRNEVNALFDETISVLQESGRKNFRELQIFIVVMGDSRETRDLFLRFLHDVATCPPEVIRWCQRQLYKPALVVVR